jgi:hypothetical protein
MNNKFTFTNKEEYLAYRQSWKAEYKELSNTIRDIKWGRKFINKASNKAHLQTGSDSWNANYRYIVDEELKNSERYQTILKKVDRYDFWNDKHKKTATEMLKDLKLAKAEAQRQYLEQKNLVTA